jgi:glycerol dehydrogenase
MTTILTPRYYLSKPGAISEAGDTIKQLAKKALVVGSKTAFREALPALAQTLNSSGVAYETLEYNGYPTEPKAKEIAGLSNEHSAEALIAVGGGRINDLTKAAASFANLPIITVPTIGATCASWAASSILYNGQGEFTGAKANENSPVFVVLDTDIIAKAPVRYLQSGIADALARWYENSPHLKHSGAFYLQWKLKQAELIRDILEKEGPGVIADLKKGIYNPAEVVRIIDAVVFLTGIFVSVRNNDELFYGGIAHNIYHTSTCLHELHNSLHGEQIAFGLIVSSLLEKKPDEEVNVLVSVFDSFDQPLTLAELGYGDNASERLDIVLPKIYKAAENYRKHITRFSEEELKSAIFKADGIGRKIRSANFELSKLA